jgi:hypothetical protein
MLEALAKTFRVSPLSLLEEPSRAQSRP